jgi:hypothetical protein
LSSVHSSDSFCTTGIMPEATEVVYLIVKEGVTPAVSGTPGNQKFLASVKTLSERPGYLRSFYVSEHSIRREQH